MIIAIFLVNEKIKLAQRPFLLANIAMSIALGIPFFTMRNENINQMLNCKLFIPAEVLSTTKYVELINRKEFAATILNPNNEIFIIYIIIFSFDFDVYLFHKV